MGSIGASLLNCDCFEKNEFKASAFSILVSYSLPLYSILGIVSDLVLIFKISLDNFHQVFMSVVLSFNFIAVLCSCLNLTVLIFLTILFLIFLNLLHIISLFTCFALLCILFF